jgi:hypothetical protein
MKTKSILSPFIIVALFLPLAFTSCKKKKNETPAPPPASTPTPTPKTIKYEITGNYSGHLLVVFGGSGSTGGGNETIEVTSLPWSKTVEYASTIIAVAISAGSVSQYIGVQGQTASIKIYHGTNLVQSSNGTVLSGGVLALPGLSYVFP